MPMTSVTTQHGSARAIRRFRAEPPAAAAGPRFAGGRAEGFLPAVDDDDAACLAPADDGAACLAPADDGAACLVPADDGAGCLPGLKGTLPRAGGIWWPVCPQGLWISQKQPLVSPHTLFIPW